MSALLKDELQKDLTQQIKDQLRYSEKTQPTHPMLEQKIRNLASDRDMKRLYARGFIAILLVQLIAMNLIFIAAGLEWINFKQWQLELYMGGTLAEVFGIVLVITKNLFPQSKTETGD